MVWGAGARARGEPGGTQSAGRCTPRPLLHPLPAHSASTPESWARFTQERLQRAERERLASFNLRGLIDCVLRDTSEDLRLQCDSVNLAFGRRLEELEDARHKLEHHLNKVRQCAPATPRPVQASPGVWVPIARERPGSCALPLPPPLAPVPWSGPGLAPGSPLPLLCPSILRDPRGGASPPSCTLTKANGNPGGAVFAYWHCHLSD